MAGIGQRFTSADHSAPWNTQSQYTMGRAMMHDCSKPITTYGGNFNKRALFGGNAGGVVGAPTFSDVATFCASGYTSRPGSSQQNGEVMGSLSGGFSLRSAFQSAQDPAADNASPFFNNPIGFNGGQSGPPRNFSEPSLFPSLSTASRTVGTDLAGGRIGSSNTNNSKTSANDSLSISNSRNPGGSGSLFATSLGNDTALNNSANLTPSSSSSVSRGMKLDPSEFPPILTSTGRAGNAPGSFQSLSSQPPPLRNYVSVMSKGSPAADIAASNSLGAGQFGSNQPTPPEFSKQDFPALPGSNQQQQQAVSSSGPGSQSTSALAAASSSNSGLPRPVPLNAATGTTVAGGAGNAVHRSTNPGSTAGQGPTAFNPAGGQPSTGAAGGIQLLPNHFVANIPKNMICDQFGMLGLLKLIRVGDYDGTLNMLAPGLDLSSLHNNWQTAGELHNTFVSPCHDPCIGRPQDMDYAVPPEYLIRHLIAHRLPDPPLDQLSEETLFWLFYNCCREEAQLVVAKELYQRQWRFHKKEQIWLTRNVASNFTTDNTSEQGDYFYWDPVKAQKSTLHMTILYSDLDDAPSSFRLSSGTLSAFVSVVLPNNAAAGHHVHHSTSQHAGVQQLQLINYPTPQQQQQQQQSYPTHQSLLSNTCQPSNGSASLGNTLHHGSTGQLLGQTATGSTAVNSSSAATLASLLNARQQPQPKTQTAQVSPSTSYFQPTGMSHGRSAGLSNTVASSNATGLITSRSGPSGTPSLSPTAAGATTSLIPGSVTHAGPASSTGVSGATASNSTNAGSSVADQPPTVVRSLSGGCSAATTTSNSSSSCTTAANTTTHTVNLSGVTIDPSATATGSSSPMDAPQL